MNRLLDLIRNEPVLFQSAIQSFLTMVMAFGIHMTPEQIGAVLIFSQTALSVLTRSQVTANPEVKRQVTVALKTPVPEGEIAEAVEKITSKETP